MTIAPRNGIVDFGTFQGAGAGADGTQGLVPPPAAGDQAKSLLGDGTWGVAASGTVTSVSWTGGIVSIATATTTPAFTVAGTSGGVVYFTSASTWASSALLAANGIVVGGGAGVAPATITGFTMNAVTGEGLKVPAGTATTDVQALSLTQTWNNAAIAFTGHKYTVTDTASAAGSLHSAWYGGAAGTTALMKLSKTGAINAGAGLVSAPTYSFSGDPGTGIYKWATGWTGLSSNGTLSILFGSGFRILLAKNSILEWDASGEPGASTDVAISRISAGVIGVGTTSAGGFAGSLKLTTLSLNANGASLGAANSCDCVIKSVTGIANNTATATFTVTIPNAAHSAGISLSLTGAAGAGGAIGADEFTANIDYDIAVARTAGVNAVATISVAVGSAVASVAGGATPTITAVVSSISGAVGATNTFTVNVTINALTGSSTNHTCLCYARLMNQATTGITIS